MYGQDESTSSKCFFFLVEKEMPASRVNESENKLQCPSSFFFYYNGTHTMANEVKILLSLTSYTWLRRFSILTKDTENLWAPSAVAWPNSKFSQSASILLFDGTLLSHFLKSKQSLRPSILDFTYKWKASLNVMHVCWNNCFHCGKAMSINLLGK